MKRTNVALIWGLFAASILAPTPAPRAEVMCDSTCRCLQITEEPDPTGDEPLKIWKKVRDGMTPRVLNEDGYNRGDDAPAFSSSTNGACPVVVWAYNASTDHDIAFSEWQEDGWSDIEFLGATPDDELDPQAFIDDATEIWVVWWVNDQIVLTSRRPGESQWQTSETIIQNGRRPSPLVLNGNLLVSFERDLVAGGQQIVVLTRPAEGTAVETRVASTPRTERLDALLHVENGHVWIDWKHGEAEFAFSELLGGEWTEPTLVAWTDPSWVGVESVRRTIRRIILRY